MEDTKSYEELLKLVTHPKKRLFLEQYPNFRVSALTCQAVGVAGSTIRSWYKDEVFHSAFISLKKEIDADRLEKYERELDKRILDVPSKQSDILLMFGLKAGHPDKYREKPLTPMMIGNVTIKMDMPEELPYVDAKVIEVHKEGSQDVTN